MYGEAEPVKVFDRTTNLANNQIINYKCDPSEKWLVLIGIAPGSPERPQLVKGNMQLFSVEQQRSQALEAHAASFAQLKDCVFALCVYVVCLQAFQMLAKALALQMLRTSGIVTILAGVLVVSTLDVISNLLACKWVDASPMVVLGLFPPEPKHYRGPKLKVAIIEARAVLQEKEKEKAMIIEMMGEEKPIIKTHQTGIINVVVSSMPDKNFLPNQHQVFQTSTPSCKLCSQSGQGDQVEIARVIKEEVKNELTKSYEEAQQEVNAVSGPKLALVIDGKCLMYALDPSLRGKLLNLSLICYAAICCRVSPLQKA
ncbi:hypothetical protein ACFE04_030725 [Oxalis oulophora]